MIEETWTLLNIPLLSFFTGGGLLDMGFIDTGFPVIWHNECDRAFVEGFEFAMANRYSRKKDSATVRIQNCAQIQDVGADTPIEIEAFGRDGKRDMFGMIGGPPCPDFSSAGRQKGKEGLNGFLSGTYVERILSLQPTFFVFENVPGLLRTAKHKAYLIELLQKLESSYAVDANILNALDFGVPQDRNRVFVVGVRGGSWLEQERGRHIVAQGENWDSILDGIKRKIYRDPRKDEGWYK